MINYRVSSREPAATVRTSQGDYRVMVSRGAIEGIGPEMRNAGVNGRAFLIADYSMFPLLVRRAHEALERGGYETHALILELGEAAKTIDTATKVYEWLADQRAERIDCLVSMGGGVTTDLVGFIAGTWLRGVPVVHVPTSLAAMVDASIGGKAAVNLPIGKNLVGAFKQPRLVVHDIDFLDTLPRRELAAGWAEAIKHALILDADLLDTFERYAEDLAALSGDLVEPVIRRSVEIKAEIVSVDEFETGNDRVLLNYGHTIGHAIEAVTEYGAYLHGEAVSIGMMVAGGISQRMGLISEELLNRQQTLLERFQLPVLLNGIDADSLIEATQSDKKSRGGKIRWVLLKGPGRATTSRDVSNRIVRAALSNVLTD
jgi:3-dehydroquinate synthase